MDMRGRGLKNSLGRLWSGVWLLWTAALLNACYCARDLAGRVATWVNVL